MMRRVPGHVSAEVFPLWQREEIMCEAGLPEARSRDDDRTLLLDRPWHQPRAQRLLAAKAGRAEAHRRAGPRQVPGPDILNPQRGGQCGQPEWLDSVAAA